NPAPPAPSRPAAPPPRRGWRADRRRNPMAPTPRATRLRRPGWRVGLAVALGTVLVAGSVVAMSVGNASAATVDTTAWYEIVNHNSGKALDVCSKSTADGACIEQWTRNGG